ncbi:MAG: hypothetical protein OHK0056_33190 [Bacteriovoracaceae bacterium]
MKTNTLNRFEICFLNITHCSRCKCSLKGQSRILSWFETKVICMDCKEGEVALLDMLESQGISPMEFEGGGYIPKLDYTKIRKYSLKA